MGCLCNTSLSITLPSPFRRKAKRISTSHEVTPALGQGTLLNSGFCQPARSNSSQPGTLLGQQSRTRSACTDALWHHGSSTGRNGPNPASLAWALHQPRGQALALHATCQLLPGPGRGGACSSLPHFTLWALTGGKNPL